MTKLSETANAPSGDRFVIIRLQSLGLGNGLFQYAAARSLTLSHGEVLFDIAGCIPPQLGGRSTGVTKDSVREHFAPFNLRFGFATRSQIRQTRGTPYQTSKVGRVLDRVIHRAGIARPAYFLEKTIYGFEAALSQRSTPLYMDGTFINPRYFVDHAVRILDDVRIVRGLSGKALDLQHGIQAAHDSVSIHVRRGDYAKAMTGGLYQLYGSDYVRAALERLKSFVINPLLYVFSDDPGWARANLGLPEDATFVSDLGTQPWEDLLLMQSCKHHVVANSTFSWWGAFASRRSGGVTVCPLRWRTDGIDTGDMIMPGWIAI